MMRRVATGGGIGLVARLLVLAVVAAAAGCGFQLRGLDVRASVPPVYVDAAPRHSLADPLRRALGQAGVAVVDAPEAASLIVALLDERSDRRSVSVSEGALAAEYEVQLGVRYEVRDRADRELIEAHWVDRERVYRADRDNIVGSSEEQALLMQEMQRDLIQQIIRTLDAAAGRRNGG
jgi:LPS-assembly lipoprotein